MTIRRLLLQNKEGIINFVKDCYDKMMMKNGKEDLLQKDWLCYLLDKKNNQKAHLAHLFSIIHSMNENPEKWFYQITEVPTVSFYYEQMIDFCKHKLKKTSSINLQLYFIDLQQMISHSHQHYSIAIKELIEKDTVEFIDQIKDSLICIVNTLWENAIQGREDQETVNDQFDDFKIYQSFIQSYPVIVYPSNQYKYILLFYLLILLVFFHI